MIFNNLLFTPRTCNVQTFFFLCQPLKSGIGKISVMPAPFSQYKDVDSFVYIDGLRKTRKFAYNRCKQQ